MDWLTSATSPWWSAPVTSLATLVLGAYVGRWSAGQQAANAKAESDAARDHASTMADKQHEADRQARLEQAQQHDQTEQQAARREAIVRVLEALAALRGSLAQSARRQPPGVSPPASKPVPEEVVSELISATSRLSLIVPSFFADWEVENLINQYVTDWPALNVAERKDRADEIDSKMIQMRADVFRRTEVN